MSQKNILDSILTLGIIGAGMYVGINYLRYQNPPAPKFEYIKNGKEYYYEKSKIFINKNHPYLTAAVNRAANKYKIDPILIYAIMDNESGYNNSFPADKYWVNARLLTYRADGSIREDSRGVMQINLKAHNKDYYYKVKNPYNLFKNIYYGARLIASFIHNKPHRKTIAYYAGTPTCDDAQKWLKKIKRNCRLYGMTEKNIDKL